MNTRDTTFIKMHGLGNDFVVLDGRAHGLSLTAEQVRLIADRHRGVGCDQLIVLTAPEDRLADVTMVIRNADGGEVSACGNATRCVASLLMTESGKNHAVIQTRAGLLDAERRADGLVSVDMGPARLDWRDIPLSEAIDTLHLPLALGELSDPVGVGMGNPHAVFFVPDVMKVDVATLGPVLEHHPLFPERANIEFAQILSPERIRMRVWERGAGITLACGTGACATVVAAARRGLAGRRAEVILDGGTLDIEWQKDGHVMMTGPVSIAFSGRLDPSLLS
jgi:diaminopimelate epimerase